MLRRRQGAILPAILMAALWLHPGPAGADVHEYASLGIQRLDGSQAIDFTLPGLDEKTVRLSDFRGKVVFLNFWASWCPACRVEMPSMETLHRRFRKRDFILLAVAMDKGGKQAILPFLKELGLTFSVLLDPENRVSDLYGVNLIPTTFLVGSRGELVGKTVGPKRWDGEESFRLFEKLLKERK